jgi:hypothetical protein
MFSLLLSVLVKICSIKVEPTSVPLWTEEELESFVRLWLVILSARIKTAMFLLYHSEGCNICEMVLHECYVNDLHTTTCSGMLGHHKALVGGWEVSIPCNHAHETWCSKVDGFMPAESGGSGDLANQIPCRQACVGKVCSSRIMFIVCRF